MRDGSFGPLKSGQSDIEMITQGVKYFSSGSALLAQGKRYIKLLEILRTSYTVKVHDRKIPYFYFLEFLSQNQGK